MERNSFLFHYVAVVLLVVLQPLASANEPVVTIRIAQKDLLTSNPEDVAHIERIERAMANRGAYIDIEIVDISSAGYAEKLGLMLLSRDIPDLIYFQGGDQRFASQDILEDWRPWIEKTTHLKQALWPHNIRRISNYPYLLYIFPPRTLSALVRDDWMAETGLDSPQTLEDWTEFLRIISTSDLDSDGEVNTYGITTPKTTEELDGIFNPAFGITASWLKNGDGQWIDARVSTEERDKLKYYNMLYREGLLDPEYITSNWEMKEDKFYTGRVGVVMRTSGKFVDVYRTKIRQVHPSAELTILDPPAGIGRGLKAVDVSKEHRGLAMSALSENKKEVVALLDFLASPEGQIIDRMGFEGQHYFRDGDRYEVTNRLGNWYPRFVIANPDAWSPPVDLLSPVAMASIAQGAEYFVADNAFIVPVELAAQVNAVDNYYRTAAYRFISGETSFDDWQEYVDGWYSVGGDKLTEYARIKLK